MPLRFPLREPFGCAAERLWSTSSLNAPEWDGKQWRGGQPHEAAWGLWEEQYEVLGAPCSLLSIICPHMNEITGKRRAILERSNDDNKGNAGLQLGKLSLNPCQLNGQTSMERWKGVHTGHRVLYGGVPCSGAAGRSRASVVPRQDCIRPQTSKTAAKLSQCSVIK